MSELVLTLAAAQGRSTGTWHAVELHRSPSELDGACEVAVCGALARVDAEQVWDGADDDSCEACADLLC
ncbi:hypothetical protein TEK04_08200 [Klenkia sp. LSe6-5]|uniref:Zinc finger protein n=1 Tax=Klenkia sesuvii TaxID=3103137 RepID=A0ABU8DS68_9ACTN